MGIDYSQIIPREVWETNRKDELAWWLTIAFDDEWMAKRAMLQWAREKGRRIDEVTIRSVMTAIRRKKEIGRWTWWHP